MYLMSKLSKREIQTARDPGTQAQFNISSEYNGADKSQISNYHTKIAEENTDNPFPSPKKN